MNYTQRKQYIQFILWLDRGYPGFYKQFEYVRACLRRLRWPYKKIFCASVIILRAHFPGFGDNFRFYTTQIPEAKVPWLPLVWTTPLPPQSVPLSVRTIFSGKPPPHPSRTYDGWRARLFSRVLTFELLLVARQPVCSNGRKSKRTISGTGTSAA